METSNSYNLHYEQIGKEVKCIEDELPFDIPDSWEWARLNAVGTMVRGNGIKRNEVVETGYPCIRYGEIYTSYNLSFENTLSHVNNNIYNTSKKIRQNDLVYTLTGENKPDIAKTIAYLGEEDVAAGGDLAIWSNHHMNALYLSYLLSSPYMISNKVKLATGDIIVHISVDKVGSFIAPIPPLNEQNRIVKQMMVLEKLLEEYSDKEEKLFELNFNIKDQLKKSILQYAIEGKLVKQDPNDEPASVLLEKIHKEKEKLIAEGKIKRDKNESIIYRRDNSYYEKFSDKEKCIDEDINFSIPENWQFVRIENYVKLVTDYVASGSFASLRENVKVYKEKNYALMVKTKDFSNRFTSDLTYTDEHGYNFLSNSNLFGEEMILSNVGSIGKVFIVPKLKQKMTLAPNSIMVRFYSLEQQPWFYYLFQSSYGYDALINISSATAIKKFNKTDFKKIIIPIPPLTEQKRIISKIEKLNSILK